jgi:hypothetical protein
VSGTRAFRSSCVCTNRSMENPLHADSGLVPPAGEWLRSAGFSSRELGCRSDAHSDRNPGGPSPIFRPEPPLRIGTCALALRRMMIASRRRTRHCSLQSWLRRRRGFARRASIVGLLLACRLRPAANSADLHEHLQETSARLVRLVAEKIVPTCPIRVRAPIIARK